MAKQAKTLPARRAQEADDSLLVRSAESLGRMIGTLQRQLDIVSRRTSIDDTTEDTAPPMRKKSATRRKTARTAAEPVTRKATARKTTARKSVARKSAARKSSRRK